jgi:mono/diheme cytochrome c family protein
MTTYPTSDHEVVQASGIQAAASCPKLAALKAQAKALKKWHKHEQRRIFLGLCAGCHALGFSF